MPRGGVELANRAYDLMISREPRERRRLLDVFMSNSTLAEGVLTVTWRKSLDLLAESATETANENGDSASRNRRHSVWSAQLDGFRTFAADPPAWCEEKVSAFEAILVAK